MSHSKISPYSIFISLSSNRRQNSSYMNVHGWIGIGWKMHVHTSVVVAVAGDAAAAAVVVAVVAFAAAAVAAAVVVIVVTISNNNVAAPPRRPVAASTRPANAKPKILTRHTNEPPVFDGNAAISQDWAFAMDIALRPLDFQNASVGVNYVVGYLTGDARLCLMAALEAGTEFENWLALNCTLSRVYGPMFDSDQIRPHSFRCSSEELWTTTFGNIHTSTCNYRIWMNTVEVFSFSMVF